MDRVFSLLHDSVTSVEVLYQIVRCCFYLSCSEQCKTLVSPQVSELRSSASRLAPAMQHLVQLTLDNLKLTNNADLTQC